MRRVRGLHGARFFLSSSYPKKVRNDDENENVKEEGSGGRVTVVTDSRGWESQYLEECFGAIKEVEGQVTYHNFAGACCINRWAKRALARRRLQLLHELL